MTQSTSIQFSTAYLHTFSFLFPLFDVEFQHFHMCTPPRGVRAIAVCSIGFDSSETIARKANIKLKPSFRFDRSIQIFDPAHQLNLYDKRTHTLACWTSIDDYFCCTYFDRLSLALGNVIVMYVKCDDNGSNHRVTVIRHKTQQRRMNENQTKHLINNLWDTYWVGITGRCRYRRGAAVDADFNPFTWFAIQWTNYTPTDDLHVYRTLTSRHRAMLNAINFPKMK